jgi:hypothetical protein
MCNVEKEEREQEDPRGENPMERPGVAKWRRWCLTGDLMQSCFQQMKVAKMLVHNDAPAAQNDEELVGAPGVAHHGCAEEVFEENPLLRDRPKAAEECVEEAEVLEKDGAGVVIDGDASVMPAADVSGVEDSCAEEHR